MEKYVFERHIEGDDYKYAAMAPLLDFHDLGRTVYSEPNIRIGSLNNAEQFSIDVSFSTFYSTAKSRQN